MRPAAQRSWPAPIRWAGSASPRTSPTLCCSSRHRCLRGSLARSSASAADSRWSEMATTAEVLQFDGDAAIVTGAGRGLGRCHALELARRGARVVVNDLAGDSDPAATVVEEINAAGGTAIANHDNIATAEGGERIVQHALDKFGSLAIVVNNAGILRDKAFHNLTPDLVEAVILVHLTGPFNVNRPARRHLRSAGYGRVVK